MSKHLDLQGIPADLTLLQNVMSGQRDPNELFQFNSLIEAIRSGRMTPARIKHVREHYDRQEVEMHELAIDMADKCPALIDCNYKLLTRDGILEFFLVEYAKSNSFDPNFANGVVRGCCSLHPVDAAIGWSDVVQTQKLSAFLAGISFPDFYSHYDVDAIVAAEVYKAFQITLGDEETRKDSLGRLLQETKDFYVGAVEQGLAVLSVRWG